MGLIEIIFMGIGLSMDAVAVSLTNGMVYKNIPRDKRIAMPVLFGLFQGLMPVLGFLAGGLFADVISQYAGILVFLILGFIGGKMLKDAFTKDDEEEVADLAMARDEEEKVLTYKTLIMQAVATSIDAFAVGIGLSAMGVSIVPASIIITLTTLICCILAIVLGKKFGELLGNKSEIVGGIILVCIAIKALF